MFYLWWAFQYPLRRQTLGSCDISKPKYLHLTHWGRVTHICVIKLTIVASDNGLSPGRRQAIIWTNVGILLIGPLGINFSENLIEIYTFSFRKMHLKMSGKWRPFCLGLNELNMSDCYVILMAFRQQCCRCACPIAGPQNCFDSQFHGFQIIQGFMLWRFTEY